MTKRNLNCKKHFCLISMWFLIHVVLDTCGSWYTYNSEKCLLEATYLQTNFSVNLAQLQTGILFHEESWHLKSFHVMTTYIFYYSQNSLISALVFDQGRMFQIQMYLKQHTQIMFPWTQALSYDISFYYFHWSYIMCTVANILRKHKFFSHIQCVGKL